MKKLYLTFVFFVLSFFALKAGEPVPGAEVTVEQEPNEDPIAYQFTGSSGTVTIDHLDKGTYRILLKLPDQAPKMLKGVDKINPKLKSVYNPDKRTYYIKEPKGFFAVKFDGLKKIAGTNIAPIYSKERNKYKERIVIGKFTITENNGEITIKINAITPKEFENNAMKTKHDTAKAVINNIR